MFAAVAGVAVVDNRGLSGVATTVPRRPSGVSVCADDRRAVFAYRVMSPLTVSLPSMIEDCLGPMSTLSAWTIGLLLTVEDRADKILCRQFNHRCLLCLPSNVTIDDVVAARVAVVAAGFVIEDQAGVSFRINDLTSGDSAYRAVLLSTVEGFESCCRLMSPQRELVSGAED